MPRFQGLSFKRYFFRENVEGCAEKQSLSISGCLELKIISQIRRWGTDLAVSVQICSMTLFLRSATQLQHLK